MNQEQREEYLRMKVEALSDPRVFYVPPRRTQPFNSSTPLMISAIGECILYDRPVCWLNNGLDR